MYAKSVGKLTKIAIITDGKGMGADWKVDQVKIVHGKETYTWIWIILNNDVVKTDKFIY